LLLLLLSVAAAAAAAAVVVVTAALPSTGISLNLQKPGLNHLAMLKPITLFVTSCDLLFPLIYVFVCGLSEVLFYDSLLFLKFPFLRNYQKLRQSRNCSSFCRSKSH
jgi:hypothetical protein